MWLPEAQYKRGAYMKILYHEYMVHDFIGNCGVLLYVTSYWALQAKKLTSDDMLYSVMNLCGSILCSINLYFQPNLSSIIIEIFWFCISLYGVYKVLYHPQPNVE